MMPLASAERSMMQAVQEDAMMDTCLIASPSITDDAYNLPGESWNWAGATESACGLNANPSREVLNQVPTSEAVMRLPIGTAIGSRSRVRVTKRFGETESSPLTYEVIGLPRKGPSGILIWIKKVTDGSDG